MNWEDILKNKNQLESFIKLAKDNMDKFDKNEKEIVRLLIESLENKYDKDTLEALKFELKQKDLFSAKTRF